MAEAFLPLAGGSGNDRSHQAIGGRAVKSFVHKSTGQAAASKTISFLAPYPSPARSAPIAQAGLLARSVRAITSHYGVVDTSRRVQGRA